MSDYKERMLDAIMSKFGMTQDQAETAALESYCIKRGCRITPVAKTPGEDDAARLLALIVKHGPITKSGLYAKTLWLGDTREELIKKLTYEDKIMGEITSTSGRPVCTYRAVANPNPERFSLGGALGRE